MQGHLGKFLPNSEAWILKKRVNIMAVNVLSPCVAMLSETTTLSRWNVTSIRRYHGYMRHVNVDIWLKMQIYNRFFSEQINAYILNLSPVCNIYPYLLMLWIQLLLCSSELPPLDHTDRSILPLQVNILNLDIDITVLTDCDAILRKLTMG